MPDATQDRPELATGQDFIVSELMHELKEENSRKGVLVNKLIKGLATSIVAGLCAVLLTIGGFLWYLNQYDFSGTTTTTTTTTQTAEGVYALIDSEGNVVGQDLTPE